MPLSEPQTQQEYERRYTENFKVEGYGVEGVTNRFPCPFCAASDWYVVRLIDFAQSTGPIKCGECGRTAQIIVERSVGETNMHIVQLAGADAPPWVPISRDEGEDE